MQHLKDLPKDTIWPHLLASIESAIMEDMKNHAAGRANDVERGAETPALAALLLDKYCEGMAKAMAIMN